LASIVGNLCEANPEALIETVLHSLIVALEPGRAQEASDLLTLEEAGKSTVLRADVLLLVQTALVAEGFLEKDAADGVFGPMSAKALREFQAKSGLTETGLPDPATLFVLFSRG
jgi:peptidoglycan hydrolase-like protein with peptidoglycan-binding domain